jgi:predicted Rossmann-fold nucleotide-binding protein
MLLALLNTTRKMFDSKYLLKAKTVGCIGTSKPSHDEQNACIAIGYALVEMGKTVVSGNAEGCDFAYATGANVTRPTSVRLYVPNKNYHPDHWVLGNVIVTEYEPEWVELARDNHPKYDSQTDYVKNLFIRNAGIILASDYVIALPNYRNKSWGGGTGHGMKIAKSLGKPVLNISDEQVRVELLDYLRSIVGEK